ncbi:MAG: YggS family pyridoxal phosphate-dependent enzyme [Proteobacteria bacterium]|nr:YggS family pyridoxal phosphate-dependent enzyme [Pseudomonadota bacterium]
MIYNEKEIITRFLEIRKNIELAMKKVGREVPPKIIGVTKTHPVELIEIIKKLGILDVGENYVQEMLKKMEVYPDLNWHFIGTLQTNKVKYIVGKVYLIHSVDSLKLVEEIDKRAKKVGVIQEILIQINQGEETKGGIKKEGLEDFIKSLNRFENVLVKGLMAMPPFFDDSEKVRPYFKEVRQLLENINQKKLYKKDLTELSMGMSGDYMVAIEEGSTMVRIGTALFGERIKQA